MLKDASKSQKISIFAQTLTSFMENNIPLCGVISGLFAFFILGFLIFVGILYYLFRHKKSIAWIDFFIINEYYFFHIHQSFLEAKYLLVLHQYEHDLKVTYKVLIDQYHHR